MELERKEFHFDLDVDSLKRTYSDHDSSSWNAAWSDIRELQNMDSKNRSIQAMNLLTK